MQAQYSDRVNIAQSVDPRAVCVAARETLMLTATISEGELRWKKVKRFLKILKLTTGLVRLMNGLDWLMISYPVNKWHFQISIGHFVIFRNVRDHKTHYS